ncbi:hypothetical protein Bca52824_042142 [Brassica carinata]|uniref:Uncharacterized protein n=1 Tax=Brassica carinata TaxID=52824 RepID=A0A8X7RXU4_BRACI|nr:hypothetical protein Bca52824_042142 [Brassica carinata]
MPQNDTAITPFDQNSNSKAIKAPKVDWNEVDVKSISEILVAMKIQIGAGSILVMTGVTNQICGLQINLYGIVNVAVVIYKLHIVVQDNSGTCKLMLLDTEAEAIVGCKAIEDPEVLPEPIKELVGQSFCFGVSLENDNVTNGSDIFMVSQIWSGDKLLKAESHSVVSRESSMISVSKSDPNSQTTSEGCSTPFSKRKDGDLPDMSSSSKKLCTKIVKVEKSKKD